MDDNVSSSCRFPATPGAGTLRCRLVGDAGAGEIAVNSGWSDDWASNGFVWGFADCCFEALLAFPRLPFLPPFFPFLADRSASCECPQPIARALQTCRKMTDPTSVGP